MNEYRCKIVVAAVCAVWCASTISAQAQDAAGQALLETAAPTVKHLPDLPSLRFDKLRHRVDWRLLWFDKQRFIRKVVLRRYRYELFEDHEPRIVAEIAVDDPLVLANLTEGLSNGTKFIPQLQYKGQVGGVGSLPIGELEVVTSTDSFKIYFDLAFVLTEERLQPGNHFVSWTTAKTIDDLLEAHGQKRFTQDQFERLSGERWLKAERVTFEQRKKKYSTVPKE